MARRKVHPLLSALFAEMPPKDRAAWLRMVADALDVIYGAAEGGAQPAHVRASQPLRRAGYRIDTDGFALGPDGKPAAPEDIPPGTPINDMRPPGVAGDLSTVYWRDEGVRPVEKLPPLEVI